MNTKSVQKKLLEELRIAGGEKELLALVTGIDGVQSQDAGAILAKMINSGTVSVNTSWIVKLNG